MDRASIILGHLNSAKNFNSSLIAYKPVAARTYTDSDDDVVIVAALRTPICKAKRGAFKNSYHEDLLEAVFTGIVKSTRINPAIIGDICLGNVQLPGAGGATVRIAQFLSNFPETVPVHSVNRMCSSGLEAAMSIASHIKSGFYDIGLAAGVEVMSLTDKPGVPPGFHMTPRAFDCEKARDSMIPMGITSENVAAKFHVSRERQDQFAVESHAKATRAQQNGWFDDEIVPVTITVEDESGSTRNVTISKDDGIRPGTNMTSLAKLKPAFTENGSTTAGNASQISDGAAAVLLARRSAARKHNLPVLGVVRGYAVVGVPPDVMGIGPAYAIPAVLKQTGLSLDDIDIFEINEAFASQASYCVDKLGIPGHKVNPKGGAIALGHPLGCTGARQIATLLHEMKRRGKRGFGVVSMCMGTGMGAAAVLEYPGSAH